MNWLVSRLKEPSTYAGLAAFVGGLSFVPHARDWAEIITAGGAAIAGVLAIILKDKAS